jgi:hypothetical protein
MTTQTRTAAPRPAKFAEIQFFKDVSMNAVLRAVFGRTTDFEGVRAIRIFLLRLVYTLMFFVLGRTVWTHILTHTGAWDPADAMEWCVWAAFATLAGLGIIRPLKMLPILLLEIFYKLLWLGLVAYPLWSNGTLAGSSAEGTTWAFLWVALPIVAMPWGYVFSQYVYRPKALSVRGANPSATGAFAS